MNGFAAFLRKEWVEALRSYRILILGAVFLLLGIMNPLSAKFLPELVNAMMPEGMTIALAQPQALDSYLQFLKCPPNWFNRACRRVQRHAAARAAKRNACKPAD